jgi:hypothetical protein
MALQNRRSSGSVAPGTLAPGQFAITDINSTEPRLYVGDLTSTVREIKGISAVQIAAIAANTAASHAAVTLAAGTNALTLTGQEITAVVEDSLTGTQTDVPLSAAQGTALKALIDALSAGDHLVSGNFNNATNTLTFTDASGTTSTVIIPDDKVLVIDDLTTGGAGNALSAAQGVALKTLVDAKAANFLDLDDTPAAFGTVGQYPAINAATNALEWVSPASSTIQGSTDFTGPLAAGQHLVVNAAGTGFELAAHTHDDGTF